MEFRWSATDGITMLSITSGSDENPVETTNSRGTFEKNKVALFWLDSTKFLQRTQLP